MTHGSVKMIIMSHLSDLQEEIGMNNPAKNFYMTQKVNFIKYLVMRFPDTTVEINADEQWQKFCLDKKDTDLRSLRDHAFDLFETSLDKWNDQQCDAYLAEKEKPETLLEKKKLICDLEYNYIMQATESDVKDIINRFTNEKH